MSAAIRFIAWLGLGRVFLRITPDELFSLLREHRVDVEDKPRREAVACFFGATPPRPAPRRFEQAAKECATGHFESPLREYPTLRSVPNVEGRPSLFGQHLLQP